VFAWPYDCSQKRSGQGHVQKEGKKGVQKNMILIGWVISQTRVLKEGTGESAEGKRAKIRKAKDGLGSWKKGSYHGGGS